MAVMGVMAGLGAVNIPEAGIKTNTVERAGRCDIVLVLSS